jgi:ribosomal protein L32
MKTIKQIKDILLEWKNEILDRSRAALFWYAVLYIAFIITAIISPSMAAILSMCGSFILFGFLLVCTKCGYYGEKQILTIKAKSSKKVIDA